MSSVIKIGEVEAKPGEKKSGFLKVGETPLSDINIPIGIINGIRDGPILSLIAGTHGMEYPGINAAITIFKTTQPDELSGSLIIVPVVNSPAFERPTPRVNPIDNVNVSGAGLPNVPEGATISHIIAKTVFDEVISRGQYLLNLHSGDRPHLLSPFTIVGVTGDEKIDTISEKLAKIFGIKYIIHRKSSVKPSNKLNIEIPHFVAESGSYFDVDAIEIHVTGVKNIMKHLKMIKGEPEKVSDQKMIVSTLRINASRGGLFYRNASVGDVVSKGELVGEIRDVWGEVREKLVAPEDSVIYLMCADHVVNTGERLFSFGLIEE